MGSSGEACGALRGQGWQGGGVRSGGEALAEGGWGKGRCSGGRGGAQPCGEGRGCRGHCLRALAGECGLVGAVAGCWGGRVQGQGRGGGEAVLEGGALLRRGWAQGRSPRD